jgi:hypothetical protein
MAKGKHSAALFEVIVPTKSLVPQRDAGPGMVRSIAGWFRSRPRRAGGGSLPIEVSLPAPEPVYEPPPMPRRVSMPEPLAISIDSPSIDESRPGRRRDFALRMNMTTGVIAMLALGTLIGAAFIAGRRMVLGPKPLISATSSESLRMNPPTPEVTRVLPRTAIQVADPADRAIPGGGNLPRNNAVSPQQQAKPAPPAAAAIRGLPRRSKVNYVIIQSYPLQERPMAEEAKAALIKAGVECTIEKDLWKGWYSVVGTDGFETISKNPALDQYTNRIKQISKEAHDKKRSFKAFRPMPILWK